MYEKQSKNVLILNILQILERHSEVTKDRALFVTPEEQLKEYGRIRDLAEETTDEQEKKTFITVLFDALMVEKKNILAEL